MYLDGAILGNQLVLHFIIPQPPVREIFQQVRIHNLHRERTTQQLFLSMNVHQFSELHHH